MREREREKKRTRKKCSVRKIIQKSTHTLNKAFTIFYVVTIFHIQQWFQSIAMILLCMDRAFFTFSLLSSVHSLCSMCSVRNWIEGNPWTQLLYMHPKKHLLLYRAINFQIRFCFILRKINISLFFSVVVVALALSLWSLCSSVFFRFILGYSHQSLRSVYHSLNFHRPQYAQTACNINICLSYAIHDLLLYLFILFFSHSLSLVDS